MVTGRSLPIAAAVILAAAPAAAQTWQCSGVINGVPSQAVIQFEQTPNTTYVAGAIQNSYAYYSFNGEMFGGSEGYIMLVENNSGERIDRVYIALTGDGFFIQPEGSGSYGFSCR
jgi:hypothetical protein